MAGRASFNGLRVASFESRRAAETARLLETAGATAYVSPTMREVPIEGNPVLQAFARDLIAGHYGAVILMTGVGFRLMLGALKRDFDEAVLVKAFRETVTIARGPKPVAAMNEVGLAATVRIGEPNTWRDILEACGRETPNVKGARIAIQEHGALSTDLRKGLEALGASVDSVSVYEWALPEDTAPLEANLRRIVTGELDMALFTSSRQVVHVLQVAAGLGIGSEVLSGLNRLAIGSIGPTTSETLRESGLHVDFEPEHPRLGHLVAAAAERARSTDAPNR